VLLRIIVKADGALPDWKTLTKASSSALLQLECLRTIDRMQLTGELKRGEVPRTYAALHEIMGTIELLKVRDDVLERASGQFGLPLKTLDAIHLVTAIGWRERINEEVIFVTHDRPLAAAAREYDFPILGA
jgi:predicted nucleic acid-binding protein